MDRRILAATLAAAVTTGAIALSHPAHADAILTVTGTLDGTLNGTSITGTGFTATADLVPDSNGPPPGSGYTVYSPSSVTFSIQGVGALDPLAGVTVAIISPPQNPGYGTYGVDLQMPSTSLSMFFTSLSQFYVSNSDVLETLYSNSTPTTELCVPGDTNGCFEQTAGAQGLLLVSGGSFTISQFDSVANSIPLYAPEPGSLALLASGLLGLTSLARLRRRSLSA